MEVHADIIFLGGGGEAQKKHTVEKALVNFFFNFAIRGDFCYFFSIWGLFAIFSPFGGFLLRFSPHGRPFLGLPSHLRQCS